MRLDPEDADLAELHWYQSGGYLVRSVGGKAGRPGHQFIFQHRVVAERMFGPVPADRLIDHMNGVRTDNRRSNLRLVDRSQHAANKVSRNATGFRWVYVQSGGKRFQAEVRWRGQRYRKHGFLTAEEAHEWAKETAERVQGDDAFHRVRGENDGS